MADHAWFPLRRRRSLAPVIRIRQEFSKRLDALHRPRVSASEVEVRRLLKEVPESTSLDTSPLARHVVSLDRDRTLDLTRIREEALRARAGDWVVFGQPVRLSPNAQTWRTHPISGTITPLKPWNRLQYLKGELGGDVKYVWELNRHKPLLRLAQHWFLTREEASAEALSDLLDAWMEDNPPGWGINWASSLEVGFRGIAWCWIAALTADAPSWTEARRQRFLWFVWHHARHVARFDSVHHSPNTHLTGEGLALVYLGSCFPQFKKAEAWRRFGLAILNEEIPRQVLPDGMHFERATGYHRYTVEILLHTIALSRLFGRAPDTALLEPIAEQATAVLAVIRRPDGSVPILGDEDGGTAAPLSTTSPQDVAPLLVTGAALLNRWEWLDPRVGQDGSRDLAYWVLPAQTFRQIPDSPREHKVAVSVSLPAAGYYLAREREETEPWFCLVDGGIHGGANTGHAHDDCAEVEIARGKLQLSVDPGSSTYTGSSSRREWERSAAAHPTLLFESRELAQQGGPFGWKRLPPGPDTRVVEGGHYWACQVTRRMGSEEAAPLHERQVVLVRGQGILVCDWLRGAEGLPVRVTWPMRQSLEVLRLEGNSLPVGNRVRIRWHGSGWTTFSATLAAHQLSPTYGKTEAGAALLLRGTAGVLAGLVTVFSDGSATEADFRDGDSSLRVGLPGIEITFAPGRLPVLPTQTPIPNGT